MATSHINQRRIASMNRFTERYRHMTWDNLPSLMLTERYNTTRNNSEIFPQITIMPLPGLVTDVQLHQSNIDAEETGKIFRKCIVECRNDSIRYSPLQRCAFYLSALLAFLPSLKPHIINALVDSNARVNLIETQEQRARVAFVLEHAPESSSLNMCYFGQAVLMLYKNISSQCFQGFMRNITNKLMAHAVVPPNEEVQIVFRQEEASLIKTVLGSKHELKKAVFEHILEASQNRTGPFAAVCKYLCEILEWTGMESLVSIVDNLLLTRSPVLHDPHGHRISGEVGNLVEAFIKVKAISKPEYFCILEPPTEALVFERSKFPTIMDVAESIKDNQSNVVSQFLTATKSENESVASLTRIHMSRTLMMVAYNGRDQVENLNP